MDEHNTSMARREGHSVIPETTLLRISRSAPDSEDPVQKLLSRLNGVKQLPSGSWQALCPAHDDHSPSLSVSQGDDGRALVMCHAGCSLHDVLHALGLTVKNLFPAKEQTGSSISEQGFHIDRVYDYRDFSGALCYQVVRLIPKDFRIRRPDGKGGWIWNKHGVQLILYRLPELLASDQSDVVFICEGEKDADAMLEIGLIATTNACGAPGWEAISDFSILKDRRVVVIPDRDEAGEKRADRVAASLFGIANEIRVLDLGQWNDFTGKDVFDWLESHSDKEPSELALILRSSAEASPFWNGREWQEKSAWSYGNISTSLPAFPVDAFPDWLGKMVSGLAISMQTPIDLPATIALGTLSLISGGGRVEVRDSWSEPLNLYLACVLPVACRKTPCFDAMLKPVRSFEKSLQAEVAPLISKAKANKDILEGRYKNLKKSASSSDQGSQAREGVFDLAVEMDNMEIPAQPILFTSDVTPEGVVRMLEEQKGRAAVFSDEGGELIANISGRYSKDGQGNMEVILKAHAGTSIRVFRADRNRTPVSVDNPTISMVLCLQPSVIERVWKRDDLQERGMIARFLWSIPPSPLGHRISRPPICDHKVADSYCRIVTDILGTRFPSSGHTNESVFKVSPEALDIVQDLQDELEPEMNENGRFYRMSGWVGKFAGAVVRIAGILHVASHHGSNSGSDPNLIDENTMLNALKIGRYFLAHAEHAYAFFGSTDEATIQNRIQRWVQKNGFESFTEHELIRNLGIKQERIIKPLMTLRNKGCIQEAPENSRVKAGKPGRKPSRKWMVLPQAKSSSGDSVNFVNGVRNGK